MQVKRSKEREKPTSQYSIMPHGYFYYSNSVK